MKQSIMHPLDAICLLIPLLLFLAFNATNAAADDFYVIVGSQGVGTEIKSLPYTISAPGFYFIKKDLSCAAGTHGITITADNVTLDLMGFSLVGPGGSGNYDGIYMDTRANVEIRNGTVRDFMGNGITENNADGTGHRIINIRAKGNGGSGIALGGKSNIIKNCTAAGNKAYGILTAAVSTVTGNICSDNAAYGISGGDGSTITGNTCYSNDSYGIHVFASSTVTDNTCCLNGYHGIGAGTGSTVIGNTCYGNTGNGIYLSGNNLVDQNNSYSNGTNMNSCASCTFGTNHAP